MNNGYMNKNNAKWNNIKLINNLKRKRNEKKWINI